MPGTNQVFCEYLSVHKCGCVIAVRNQLPGVPGAGTGFVDPKAYTAGNPPEEKE